MRTFDRSFKSSRHMRNFTLYLSIAALIGLQNAAAQEIQLSPTFGTDGVVLSSGWEGSENAVSHVMFPDGRLVVAGTGYWSQPNSYRVTMAVIDTICGILSSEFGNEGTLVHTFEQRTTCDHLLLTSDGKLIGCGTTAPSNGVSGHKPSVYRFNMDGSVDSTFNGTGYNKSSFDGTSSGRFWKCMEQPDGKIVCVGISSTNINGGVNGIGAQRFNIDGSLDTSFSDDGIARIPASGTGYSVVNSGSGILQPDGKVLVIALFSANSTNYIGMARFNSDGTTDMAFGNSGLVVSDVESDDVGPSGLGAVRLSDGRILVSTTSTNSPKEFLMARFLPEGTLDDTYGTDGVSLVTAGTSPIGRRMDVLPDGSTLQFGAEHSSNGPPMIVKRDADGQIDQGFGQNGILSVITGTSSQRFWGGTMLPSGRIIGYGESANQIMIARLTDDPDAEQFVDLGPDLSICPGDSVVLDAGNQGGEYLWSDGSTEQTLIVSEPMFVEVTVTDPIGCTGSDMVEVNLLVAPEAPEITTDDGIELSTDAEGDLQWFLDGEPIDGATGSTLIAEENGEYVLMLTDTSGCSATSEPYQVLTVGISDHGTEPRNVHPNPATDVLRIPIAERWTSAEAIDATGRTIALQFDGSQIHIAHLSQGAYTLRLIGNGKHLHSRFIKQ